MTRLGSWIGIPSWNAAARKAVEEARLEPRGEGVRGVVVRLGRRNVTRVVVVSERGVVVVREGAPGGQQGSAVRSGKVAEFAASVDDEVCEQRGGPGMCIACGIL